MASSPLVDGRSSRISNNQPEDTGNLRVCRARISNVPSDRLVGTLPNPTAANSFQTLEAIEVLPRDEIVRVQAQCGLKISLSFRQFTLF